MMKKKILPFLTCFAWFLLMLEAQPAGQSSATFSIPADVFGRSDAGLIIGSLSFQSTATADQSGLIGSLAGVVFSAGIGYQASIEEGLDTDGDGIPDNLGNDDDNDGLDDQQEAAAGSSSHLTDTDGDSFGDFIEVIVTGTDPADENDFLQFANIVNGPGVDEMTVIWKSVSGVSNYFVDYNTLSTNGAGWIEIAGPITATGAVTSIIDTNIPADAFYRIRVTH